MAGFILVHLVLSLLFGQVCLGRILVVRPPFGRLALLASIAPQRPRVDFDDASYVLFDDNATLPSCPFCFEVEETLIEAASFTPQWNLDRIDQRWGLDGRYFPPPENGTGVDIYIMDSGVLGTHQAFAGRVEAGFDAFGQGMQNLDCHSHGTHVASTALGVGFGVATGARLISVRVLDCAGRGTIMSLAAGTRFIMDSIARNRRRAVVNMSIQSSANDAIDEFVQRMHGAGAVVVVAAANFNSDACQYSPAREPLAVTVGASSRDDSKLASSNFGPCVDLYAPGDEIVGASAFSPTGTMIKRGSSMAAPEVAGVAATIYQRFPHLSNAQVISVLLSTAIRLGRAPYDLDCSGTLEGQLFLQAMNTSYLPRMPYLARGNTLRGAFADWHDLQGMEEIDIYASGQVRVTLASAPLIHGFTSFEAPPSLCRGNGSWLSYDASTRRLSLSGAARPASLGITLRDKITRIRFSRVNDAAVAMQLYTSPLLDPLGTVSRVVSPWASGKGLGAISFSAVSGSDVTYTLGTKHAEPVQKLAVTQARVFSEWFQGSLVFRASRHPSTILYLATSAWPPPSLGLRSASSQSVGVRPQVSLIRRTLRIATGRRMVLPGISWVMEAISAGGRFELYLRQGSSRRLLVSMAASGPYLSVSLSRPGQVDILPS